MSGRSNQGLHDSWRAFPLQGGPGTMVVLLTPAEVTWLSHQGTAVLGRASFVGRSTFLHVCFWIKTVLLKEIVGSLPLASVRAAPPGCLFGGADLGGLLQEGS